jgi:hypothetical protein
MMSLLSCDILYLGAWLSWESSAGSGEFILGRIRSLSQSSCGVVEYDPDNLTNASVIKKSWQELYYNCPILSSSGGNKSNLDCYCLYWNVGTVENPNSAGFTTIYYRAKVCGNGVNNIKPKPKHKWIQFEDNSPIVEIPLFTTFDNVVCPVIIQPIPLNNSHQIIAQALDRIAAAERVKLNTNLSISSLTSNINVANIPAMNASVSNKRKSSAVEKSVKKQQPEGQHQALSSPIPRAPRAPKSFAIPLPDFIELYAAEKSKECENSTSETVGSRDYLSGLGLAHSWDHIKTYNNMVIAPYILNYNT